eukprot:1155142-Pelagomonas_calceolata.AAC.3
MVLMVRGLSLVCTSSARGVTKAIPQAPACGQQLDLWFSLKTSVVLSRKLLGMDFLSWQTDYLSSFSSCRAPLSLNLMVGNHTARICRFCKARQSALPMPKEACPIPPTRILPEVYRSRVKRICNTARKEKLRKEKLRRQRRPSLHQLRKRRPINSREP